MRRMYSKKQLEELISEMSGDILKVTNVKQLNDEQCNGLKVGDIVAKKTGKQYHCYIVTFKQDKGGLCLSYFDASVVETQSYDYTAGHWVYNSEDKTTFGDIGHTDNEVKALAKAEVEATASGTIQDALGLDSTGNLVKGVVSGGAIIYKHTLSLSSLPSAKKYSFTISQDNSVSITATNFTFESYGSKNIILYTDDETPITNTNVLQSKRAYWCEAGLGTGNYFRVAQKIFSRTTGESITLYVLTSDVDCSDSVTEI